MVTVSLFYNYAHPALCAVFCGIDECLAHIVGGYGPIFIDGGNAGVGTGECRFIARRDSDLDRFLFANGKCEFLCLKLDRWFFYGYLTASADTVHGDGNYGNAVFDGCHNSVFVHSGDAFLAAFPFGAAFGGRLDGQAYCLPAVEGGGTSV